MKSLRFLPLLASLSLVGCAKGDHPSILNIFSSEETPARQTDPLLAQPTKPSDEATARLVKSDYVQGDVTAACELAITNAKMRFAAILAVKPEEATFDNTMLAFENTVADFSDDTSMLTFMKYVSTNSDVQSEGATCEEKVGNFLTGVLLDKKMYAAIKQAAPRNASEKRLAEQTLLSFEQNGMNLSDADLAKLKDLNEKLNKLQADYSNALNLDKSHIEVTAAQLAGMPQSFLDRLQKTPDGKLIVNANEADYPAVMANCSVEQTRHDIMQTYLRRGGQENLDRLAQAVGVRQEIAKLVLPATNEDGSAADQTWVTYQVRTRMAKSKAIVTDFLDGLKGKLADRSRQDVDELLAFKKTLDPQATKVNAWDIGYLQNQLKKKNFAVDEEEVRKYFPADVVIDGLFSVYSEMLGVDYKEVAGAKVWAEGVKLFEVRDHADNRLIGFFYADFYPRPETGKYSHAAAFPMISGRILADGSYSFPVAAVVANISPPVNGQAALLSHDDVETVFHEFGHIMHNVLTRAPYASLAGTSVARDFVEAPSQMLENWVWQPEVLKKLSGLASDHSQHLPDELLAKMIAARDFQQGYFYTKQLLYGSFDIAIHSTTAGPVDVNGVYNGMYQQLLGVEPIDGQMFPASFGHLMGGYDAGYYGYMWSKVYAQDMFSKFKEEGITSKEVGMRYRKTVLEYGNMKDALDILPMFLGRAPSNKAFYDELGIQP